MRELFFGLGVLAGLTATDRIHAADEAEWLTDYSKAQSIARESKRPLFIVFR